MKKLEEEKNYKVKKVFNNNVVLAQITKTNKEVILVGKGLGFAKKIGDVIKVDEGAIEKEFVAMNEDKKEEYQQLVEQVDSEVIGLTEEIIAMLTAELGEELDEHIHISLADHIGFYLNRIKEGIEISNPFLAETKTLYSLEYNLAKKAVKMIEERFDIEVPEGEVGFITFHIHGARTKRGVSKTVKYTKVIKEMVNVIEEELEVKLSYQSLNYARLITHLRFALERIEKEKKNENPLLERIINDFEFSYQLANKLANLVKEKLELDVPEDEIGYLAMHIERLRKNLSQAN
ncbi:transcription antiterminator [Natroniella sulfidigena]|uniref:glucose PTS transporter transcription antiterminator GlcT n=1 Tax=Natroniella sulfidigena TaxID=723921 RepID=UPI00200A0FCE|nr:transcription antiterminator [Natroniella sulfidigena]MCK8816969.1 transcription antiterminator [Natroniella sulfidigena]